MRTDKGQVVCNLKSFRKAKGLSQIELADRAGIKRQAIYDMETGKYVPNTMLALRLSKELGCTVEELFILDESPEEQSVTMVEKSEDACARVSVARVRDRLIAYPLDGKWLFNEGFQAADGFLTPGSKHFEFIKNCTEQKKKVFLLGCDPAFSLLGAHASRWQEDARVQCRFASSRLALERLGAGDAHVAGTHLHSPSRDDSNIVFAKKILLGTKAIVVAFSLFEEGLMVAPGNPLKIEGVADLTNRGVRFVNRENGAALRILLDDRLAQAGISGDSITGYDSLLPNHSRCAQAVSFHIADAALGLRAVAAAYGLDFVPLETVRCDLVIPSDLLEFAGIKILLDVLQTRSLHKEIAALPGYDASCTGKIIGQV